MDIGRWWISGTTLSLLGDARELNVAFQMDGDENQDNYQTWLDKVTLYYL